MTMIIIKTFDCYKLKIVIEWVVAYRRFLYGKIPNSNLHSDRGDVTMFLLCFLSPLISIPR